MNIRVNTLLTTRAGLPGFAGLMVRQVAWQSQSRKPLCLLMGATVLQAEGEVDTGSIEVLNSAGNAVADWLKVRLPEKGTLAYDPALHTFQQITQLEKQLSGRHASVIPATPNPVDMLWDDQPVPPCEPVFIHPVDYAGQPHTEKCEQIASVIREQNLDACLLTQPDSICWLLNIRGSDIPYNPLPLCYALLHKNAQVTLFISPEKISGELREYFGEMVAIVPMEELEPYLRAHMERAVRIGYDTARSPVLLHQWLNAAGLQSIPMENPCLLPKACKNTVEIEGMREAHRMDGVAVTRFLSWFDLLEEHETISELDVVTRLEDIRQLQPDYKGPGFATIAGAGPHGAIVHYRADERSNRMIERGDILLLDSGGQYPQGTTDITRTIARGGEASATFKEHFTRVLKGHIALAQAQFPAGTGGSQLDILARKPLWEAGLDYEHGTGHGVGSYLCVHEGPQRISKRGGDVALKPGMILSNEPGYYRSGEYGIRIENLVLVVDRGREESGDYLGFSTLTLAPIDTGLLRKDWLTDSERSWLNTYHQKVADSLSPLLDTHERQWLAEAVQAV